MQSQTEAHVDEGNVHVDVVVDPPATQQETVVVTVNPH